MGGDIEEKQVGAKYCFRFRASRDGEGASEGRVAAKVFAFRPSMGLDYSPARLY